MQVAAARTSERKQSLVSIGWIINRNDDLIWFIGSVITSYAFLAANLMLVKLGMSVMIMTWIWALGFDGPHVVLVRRPETAEAYRAAGLKALTVGAGKSAWSDVAKELRR